MEVVEVADALTQTEVVSAEAGRGLGGLVVAGLGREAEKPVVDVGVALRQVVVVVAVADAALGSGRSFFGSHGRSSNPLPGEIFDL